MWVWTPGYSPSPLDIATRGHGSSQISCRPFCYWNLMIRCPRGAPLHKYLRDKSLHRSTCLLSQPLILTTFPRTLSFYYADSYTDLPVTWQLYDLRFNSVRPRDSPPMIPLSVRNVWARVFSLQLQTVRLLESIFFYQDLPKIKQYWISNFYIRFPFTK